MKGMIVSGGFGSILVREKSDNKLELGELLVSDSLNGKILLQVFDLFYGSQLTQQNLELISGLRLEEDASLQLMDEHIREYVLARVKNLIFIQNNKISSCKTLPSVFSFVREVKSEDLTFLTRPENPLFLGFLRSGSKVLDVPIFVDGVKAFSHHLLICGTTGRGKSVFMTNLLWKTVDQEYCGLLVLDPHDEYFGRTTFGLKDHPLARSNIVYYTSKNPPPGSRLLQIHTSLLHPKHFSGVIEWSDPQYQALNAYYREYEIKWIESIITDKPLSNVKFGDATIAVVKRILMQLLGIQVHNSLVVCKGVFSTVIGETTIHDVIKDLQNSKTVIIDTSEFAGSVELLIGSMIATELLDSYKGIASIDLAKKPVISIVLEEAPRVLGKDVLERGNNIFSTIAREGRKFRVGLTAITQLPSLIPRDILANMNTKIILGVEMKQERQALIESSAQDLSDDDRTIASLDKGEALVSSTFVHFATPIRIPNTDLLKGESSGVKNSFDGLK